MEEPTEEVDTSPPVITVSLSPQPFSPDGDGIDDELTVNLKIVSPTEIRSWHIEIREPVPPYNLFSEWRGEGMPPETLIWDGLSSDGELVQSASEYNFALMVSNMYDHAIYQGKIEVDVLVRREENILRIIVPSIVFAPNSAEFIKGVAPDVAENNEKILLRIADVLNRFNTYTIEVEGHANPTTPPGRQRDTEETRGLYRGDVGLQPLSESRAKAVVNYLASHGVEAGRLTPTGVGGTRNIVDYTDKNNVWKNRRVEFILMSKGDAQ
jgi:outer membrane protein OmpA-like peptidoglycan-associated protein